MAEENQMRLDLQMTLDSKESDIEQLRSQITSLSIHSLDSTSISSGNDLDLEGYPGRPFILLSSSQRFSLTFIFRARKHFFIPFFQSFLFPHYASSFSSLLFHLNFSLHGPVQCALLTLTPQNQCPSPTSAHTNPSASTLGQTFARLTLSLALTLRTKKSMMGVRSGAKLPWPLPMNRPLSLKPNLNLEVTLHGSSKPGYGLKLKQSKFFWKSFLQYLSIKLWMGGSFSSLIWVSLE